MGRGGGPGWYPGGSREARGGGTQAGDLGGGGGSLQGGLGFGGGGCSSSGGSPGC